MKSITVDEIIKLDPCKEYTRGVLEEIFDGRKCLDLFDIACENDVLEDDRLWLLIRMLPDRLKHVFACDCAERALLRERDEGREPDNRLWEAIRTKRLWIDGHATDEQLIDAHVAAYTAYTDAASASSSASASAAYAYSSAAAASASASSSASSSASASAAYAYSSAAAAADAADAAHAASYASADAAAHSAATDAAYTAYVEAYAAARKQELNWQIDRLISLAIKHDA